MRAVLQRVTEASVEVAGETIASIGPGLVVLVAVHTNDSVSHADQLALKIADLRVFPDEAGRFNRSARDADAEILVISQFTLYADTHKGKRPNFIQSADAAAAKPLIDRFSDKLRKEGLRVATGRFGASMLVRLANDGPVTVIVDVD